MKKRQVLLMGIAIHLFTAIGMGIITSTVMTSYAMTVSEMKTISPKKNSKKDSLIWHNDTLSISEVIVRSNFTDKKKSPIRHTTINNSLIKERAAAKSYPEMIKNIPGLYATSSSGNFGDAKVNIRGFKQENISILLNGIPISGQTSGSMYWNNWMGLTDATYAIQVQKGVGSSMLSDNSVGGTINILTTPSTEKFYIDAGMYGTQYGSGKGYITINSGELPNGWSMNFMASYLGGKGYVNETDVSAFSYMLNIQKSFGLHHSLTFTALGSPEKHYQRNSKLSKEEIDKYGIKYNKNWGLLNGKAYNLSRNNYFKPYFTLQHRYSKGKWSMQNSIYLALANGGGRWNESKKGRMNGMLGADGQIDFEHILQDNRNVVESGRTGEEGSAQHILTKFMAGHTQIGAIVSGSVKLNNWTIQTGVHYQHYSTWAKEKITDLLGGKYWWEDNNVNDIAAANGTANGGAGLSASSGADSNASSGAGGDEIFKKGVGDFIRTHNGKVTDHFTLYTQANWENEKWNINLGLSAIGAFNQRWDKYNYTEDEGIWSDRVFGKGFSSKIGILYRPNDGHSLYINGGIYSRLPYPKVWFSSGNNDRTKDVKNEKNLLAETGYRYIQDRFGMEFTGYISYWKNKTLMSNRYKQTSGDEKRFMINGLDALHYGIELEGFWKPTWWLKLSGFSSIGNWTWQNDVVAKIYDDYNGSQIGSINVYTDGLHVGDAPQTQFGCAAECKFLDNFTFKIDWSYNDRMYADFDPSRRTNAEDRQESWKLPSWNLVNAHLGWTKKLKNDNYLLSIFMEGGNLLDAKYIERGKDGRGHDEESFRGFWGFGRNFSLGTRFRF